MKSRPENVTISPMRRLLPLLPLLALACQQVSLVEQGDDFFKVGRYRDALTSYRGAVAEQEPVVALDRRIDETKFRIIVESVVAHLQLHQAPAALKLLEHAELLRPGHPIGDDLRERAHRLIADEHAVMAYDLLQADQVAEALAHYTRALDWVPTHEEATLGQQLAIDRQRVLREKGEEYFFLGLEELHKDNSVRALTAFANAVNYHGDESRAAQQAESIAILLSDIALDKAQYLSQAGLVGPASLAARDAVFLNSDNQVALELADDLAKELAVIDELNSSESASRGGRLDSARAYLAEAAASGTKTAQQRIPSLQQRILSKADQVDYLLARSCELDQQLVRALSLYQSVVARTPDNEFDDINQRIITCEASISAASSLIEESERAQAAGDFELSRQLYAQSRQLVRDLK